MEKYNYDTANRFAMTLGLRVGLVWIVSFILVVLSFPSLFSDLGLMVGLVSLPLVGMNLRRFRRALQEFTPFRLLWTSWYTFLCGVLLLTAAQYAYFAFFDKGQLLQRMTDLYTSPEMTEALRQAGAADMLDMIHESLELMGEMTTKEMMMGFLFMNMFLGLAFSLLAMLFTIGAGKAEQA